MNNPFKDPNYALFALILITIAAFAVSFGLRMDAIEKELWKFRNTMNDFIYLKDHIEMYEGNLTEKVKTTGLYFPSEKYYCVWTEGREKEQIQGTVEHERCHALIDLEEKHFCGG